MNANGRYEIQLLPIVLTAGYRWWAHFGVDIDGLHYSGHSCVHTHTLEIGLRYRF